MLDLLIFGLANYRITRLITRDTITAPLRERLWRRFPPETTRIGYLSTCEWCVSIWSALLIVLWSILDTDSLRVVLTVFALSALAGLLTAYEDK